MLMNTWYINVIQVIRRPCTSNSKSCGHNSGSMKGLMWAANKACQTMTADRHLRWRYRCNKTSEHVCIFHCSQTCSLQPKRM